MDKLTIDENVKFLNNLLDKQNRNLKILNRTMFILLMGSIISLIYFQDGVSGLFMIAFSFYYLIRLSGYMQKENFVKIEYHNLNELYLIKDSPYLTSQIVLGNFMTFHHVQGWKYKLESEVVNGTYDTSKLDEPIALLVEKLKNKK